MGYFFKRKLMGWGCILSFITYLKTQHIYQTNQCVKKKVIHEAINTEK